MHYPCCVTFHAFVTYSDLLQKKLDFFLDSTQKLWYSLIKAERKGVRNMRKLIQHMKRRNIFTETLAFIAIPAVFVILILIVTVFIYSNSYKNMVKNSCLSTLETFCSQQESSMQNISHSIGVLSENKRFVDTIDGDLTSLADITYIQKILRKIKLNHSCIDSISVFERDSMQVYTNNNVYSAVDYFSIIYY